MNPTGSTQTSPRHHYPGMENCKFTANTRLEKDELPSSQTPPASLPRKQLDDLSEEDDVREEDALCIKLKSDGQTDENYAFKKNVRLETICEPTEEIYAAQENLFRKTLVFPFGKDPKRKPCKEYSLTVSYHDFLYITKNQREFSSPPLKSIRWHGSSGAKALGSKAFQHSLEKLGPQYHAYIQKIDSSHIDGEVDDVDTFIDMRVDENQGNNIASLPAEDGIINYLISLHHEKLTLKICFDDRSSITQPSFKNVVDYLSEPRNRFGKEKAVSVIEVEGEDIPWLKGVKITGIQLGDFYKEIDLEYSNVKSTLFLFSWLNRLACTYVFQSEQMFEFVKSNAFTQFDRIRAEAPNGNTTREIKNWIRLVCKSTDGGFHDIILCYVSKVRKKRVAFQGISLDLLPRLNGVKTIAIKGTLQALFDKYNRLIRWVNLDYAKPTDYAIYWMLIANQYRCVLEDTQDKLLKIFIKHCSRYSTSAQAFITVIKERLDKRSTIKPDLNFAFIFNALGHLPSSRFSSVEIFQILKHLNSYVFSHSLPALPPSLNLLASPLFNKKVNIKTLMALLQLLAWHHRLGSKSERSLAPLKAHPTFHGRVQVVIEGRGFTFASDLVQAFDAFLEAYLAAKEIKDEKGLNAISQILSHFRRTNPYYFDENLDIPKLFRNVDHEKLVSLAEKALKSNDAELFKQGYILLLFCFAMKPAKEYWIALLRHFPGILQHEKNVVLRKTILSILEKNIKKFLPDLQNKELEFLLAKLKVLCENSAFDSQVIFGIFFETVLRVNHKELNQIIFNSWDFFVSSINLQKLKKKAQTLLSVASSKVCLKVIKTLEKVWTSQEFAAAIGKAGSVLFKSTQSLLEEIQNIHTIFSLMQKCLKKNPNLKSQFEPLVAGWVYAQYKQKKVEKALEMVWMAMTHDCFFLEPLCQAAKIYLQQEDSNLNDVEQCLGALISAYQADNTSERGELYLDLFIFLSQQNKGKYPEIQETVEVHCQNLILKGENKTKLLIELKSKGLLQNPSAILFKIIEDRFQHGDLEAAVNVWNEGKDGNVWDQLDFSLHETFFSNFIERLFASNRKDFLQLAETLYLFLKEKCPNTNSENVFKQHLQKEQGIKLRQECTIKKAKKTIEETLKNINLKDQAEVASSKAFIKTWLLNLIRANDARRKEAVQLLQNPLVHSLYGKYPLEFIALCQSFVSESIRLDPKHGLNQYILILNQFFQKQPIVSLDKVEVALLKFLKSIEKDLKEEDLLSSLEMLVTMKSVYLPLWVLIVTPLSLDKKENVDEEKNSNTPKNGASKKAFEYVDKVLREHPKICDHNKYPDWFELEILRGRLLADLYATEPEAYKSRVIETFTTLQDEKGEINQRFKQYNLFERRLSHFFFSFLTKIDKPNFKILIKDFQETVKGCVQKLDGFFKKNPEDNIKIGIVIAYSKILMRCGKESFMRACQLIKKALNDPQLLKDEKNIEAMNFNIVSLFYYKCSQFLEGADIISSLQEIVALYDKTLIYHTDPCYLMEILSGFSEETYIFWAGKLALSRFKKIHLYKSRINDQQFKAGINLIYLALIEKLRKSSDEQIQKVFNELIRHPELKQVVGEKEWNKMRSKVIATREFKGKVPRNAVPAKIPQTNEGNLFQQVLNSVVESADKPSSSLQKVQVDLSNLRVATATNPLLKFFTTNHDLELFAQTFWSLLKKFKEDHFFPQQGSKREALIVTQKEAPKFAKEINKLKAYCGQDNIYKLVSLIPVLNTVMYVYIEYLYNFYQINFKKDLDIEKLDVQKQRMISDKIRKGETFISSYFFPETSQDYETIILKAMDSFTDNSKELQNNATTGTPIDTYRLPLFMCYVWFHIQKFISLYPKQIDSILKLYSAFLHYEPFTTKEIEELHYKLCHLVIPQDFLSTMAAAYSHKPEELLNPQEFFLFQLMFYGTEDFSISFSSKEKKELIWEHLEVLLNHSCVFCNARAYKIIQENILRDTSLFGSNPYKFCLFVAELLTYVINDPIQETYYRLDELVNLISLLTTQVPLILVKKLEDNDQEKLAQWRSQRLELWKSLLGVYRQAINNSKIEPLFRNENKSLQITALAFLSMAKLIDKKQENSFEAELKEFAPLISDWHNHNIPLLNEKIKLVVIENADSEWKKGCINKGIFTYKLYYAETLQDVWGALGASRGKEWKEVSKKIFTDVMDALLNDKTQLEDPYHLQMALSTLRIGFQSGCFAGDYLSFITYADVVLTALCVKRSDSKVLHKESPSESLKWSVSSPVIVLNPLIEEILLEEMEDTQPLQQIEKQKRVDAVLKWFRAIHEHAQAMPFMAVTHDLKKHLLNPILQGIFNGFPKKYQELLQITCTEQLEKNN